MTTLQDIMGLITKRKIKTPSDNDYIISAAYTDSQERLKPQPKMEANLLNIGALKKYVQIGSVAGTGTNNFLTKWTSNGVIGDSLIQDDGNIVSVYGTTDSLLYLNKALSYTYLLNTDMIGILNYQKITTIGDVFTNFNGTTLSVDDSIQIIELNSQRVKYLGQTTATIAAFTGNTAGQLAYNSDSNNFQYYNGTAWAAVAPKTTYMMTGVFANMFGGDPGGLNKDILEWSPTTPAASHSSVLPILQNCRITAAGFKWISSTAMGTINPGDSWTVNVYKMTNPLTGSTTADGNFTLVGSLNITLTSANSGTTPGIFSSGLNVVLNAGDIIRIAGIETGTIATSTEEAQLSILIEVI